MKIHDLVGEDGRVFAFEISNSLLSRKGAAKIVGSIPGATVISTSQDDEFVVLEFDGVSFKMFEPFGDSSRYWVGPEPVKWCKQISVVREAFAQHKILGILG